MHLSEATEPVGTPIMFCREVIGDPRNGIICGRPVTCGSYCADHAQKNYTESKFKEIEETI